jgi:HAMP domain-containing protein
VTGQPQESQAPVQPPGSDLRSITRRASLKLFRKLLVYHLVLLTAVVLLAMQFPNFAALLPIGGVTELVESGDLTVTRVNEAPAEETDNPIVNTVIRATSTLDRLGYARQLIITLFGVWLLMWPVSWVHRGIHQVSYHDHSLDETTLILPGVVAGIVLVVQHSLALAFSLAGIVAGVQFRRALQDTFDALFILVAIGTGIAAGVKALEIAAVLTVFFTYATLYVHYFGDGLESDYIARDMERKHALKEAAARQLAEKANPHA